MNLNHPFMDIAVFALASFGWGGLIAGAAILASRRRRSAAPTKHNRRYRDAPERNLSREIQEGMAELNERDNEDRVRYEFLGQTGFEE
jgi:hypothetical protein